MHLTQLGAQYLWESFHMPSPDIRFVFDMRLPGYWSPAKAEIVANLDQVYEHKVFKAAVATPQFEFAINSAIDELAEKKVIRVVQIGGGEDPNSQFNQMVKTGPRQAGHAAVRQVAGDQRPARSGQRRLGYLD